MCGGGYWRTCAKRDNEPRPVWTSLPITHVFITAVPITKLFLCVGGETMEDMCYKRLRAKSGRLCQLLLFITAVPNTKLCVWGEEDSGGHVL